MSPFWLLACAVVGSTSVELLFALPKDDGGVPVLGYIVTRQQNWLGEYAEDVVVDVTPQQSRKGVMLSATVSGLVPSTAYRYVTGDDHLLSCAFSPSIDCVSHPLPRA